MEFRGAYSSQKSKAKRRGIPWEFTYATWIDVWRKSGKLPERGAGNGKYVMARYGDRGPYSPDNVRIALSVDNILEYWNARRHKSGPRSLHRKTSGGLNFSDGRLDMMDPLELLELSETSLDL